jgi:hypothetical protein
MVIRTIKKLHVVTESEDSSPRSQKSATTTDPESLKFTLQIHNIYCFFQLALRPVYLILLCLVTVILSRDFATSRDFYYATFLTFPVSFASVSDPLLLTPFSSTTTHSLSLSNSLRVTDQLSHPGKTIDKIILAALMSRCSSLM